ncbi:MAG: hypothetical protein QOK34_593 [Gaiellaceae bacterium]|jgi:hypothetical protein|nr:hypothetical protein [Gaiellaceae bacterium]MDX6435759.1 hypothetical protein [Gaiellaceae bacterium]
MDEWLTQARDALAAATGAKPAELDLSDADAETLLDLARIAAHTSGSRTNAPLLCYLVGRAQGTRGVDELAEVIRRSTS